jgi:hypothetical protein
MSDSFVEKLTLIVATVLWARASEFDFPKTGHKMATGDREDGPLNEKVDYNKEAL